jgi:two-component system sensor histidine kinase DegS
VPRPEIKATYNAALDARSRLVTVQSQMERFEQDRGQLEKNRGLLENLLQMLEGVAAREFTALPGDIGAATASGLDPETIIRLVQSQESERQRLAKQIHDGPAQSLTNFILQAEICRRLFDRNPDRAGEELDNLKTSASTTFQKVREFIFELRPMMLDDLGVAPTMRRYLEVYSDKTGIETQFTLLGEERRRLEAHTEVVLFRGLQELLNYARDASTATRINISLDISANPVKAIVAFNGKPLEESETELEASKNRSLSLNNLVERVELVGGKIDLRTIEGEGNQVEIALPLGD